MRIMELYPKTLQKAVEIATKREALYTVTGARRKQHCKRKTAVDKHVSFSNLNGHLEESDQASTVLD